MQYKVRSYAVYLSWNKHNLHGLPLERVVSCPIHLILLYILLHSTHSYTTTVCDHQYFNLSSYGRKTSFLRPTLCVFPTVAWLPPTQTLQSVQPRSWQSQIIVWLRLEEEKMTNGEHYALADWDTHANRVPEPASDRHEPSDSTESSIGSTAFARWPGETTLLSD